MFSSTIPAMEMEVVIGLEIHAQLSTNTKMWCSCDNDSFGAKPNTRTCPVCTGFPGMLPTLNAEALKKGIRAASALGCTIKNFSKFDRKNYFYPDLPTGFQISQYDQPISENGKVEILFESRHHKIGITRAHLENDAGKLTHTDDGTLVDFNRAGAPLLEIVSEPDLRSPEEAKVFAQEIQKILRAVDASDADMEKGMMRFDASISLRPVGEKKLYPRAEVKNLNSFTGLQRALEFEIARQKKLWSAGTPPDHESTRGWDDATGKTRELRKKESADDYRYFPEPDLPPLRLSDDEIAELCGEIPELPLAKMTRYRNELKLTEAEALRLSEEPALVEFFEATAEKSGDAKKSANLILSVLLADPEWGSSAITPDHVADVIRLTAENKISSTGGKQILESAMRSGEKTEKLMTDLGLEQVSDTGAIKAWCAEALMENPAAVEKFKNGKENIIGFLVGQVMKKSGGAANPPVVQEILREQLKK